MSKAKLQDRAFYNELIGTMPAVVDGMGYILLIISDEGAALQVSNIPPEEQRYYLEHTLELMKSAQHEFFPGKDKH